MLTTLKNHISALFGPDADWFGGCLLCRQPCQRQPLLCDYCQQALRQTNPTCRYCATPLPDDQLICGHCQHQPPLWQRLQVIGDYQPPYTQLIPQLKYSHQILLAPLLARLLADHLDITHPPQAILPVPLHWWRQWWRGFNQAQELGMTLSKLTHIPLDTNVLRRCKATPSQTTLSANQRQHNLQDAFQINPHHYQHVALLDDVVTTGATAGQLTELLHQSGITTVEVWALCRTLKHPH